MAVLLRRMADAHVLSQYDCITTIEDANRARWSAAKSGYRLSMDGNAGGLTTQGSSPND